MHYVKSFNINGVDTKQVGCIELQGKPNAATEGAVGVLGIDVTSPTRDVYKCVAVNGSIYTWELLSSGMSVISSTNASKGASKVNFEYASLLTPNGYILKAGDLIIDKGGYLYQVTALGNSSCEAKYTGTQLALNMVARGISKIEVTLSGGRGTVNLDENSLYSITTGAYQSAIMEVKSEGTSGSSMYTLADGTSAMLTYDKDTNELVEYAVVNGELVSGGEWSSFRAIFYKMGDTMENVDSFLSDIEAEINKLINTKIVQTLGDSEAAVVSQRATTEVAIDARNAKIAVFDTEYEEIQLQKYPKINFNLEHDDHDKWTADSVYGGVLIPASELGKIITVQPITLVARFVFLKDTNISNGAYVDFCENTKYYKVNIGSNKTLSVPKDCKFLYVYIGDGSKEVRIFNEQCFSDITEFQNALSFENYTVNKALFRRGTIKDYDGTGDFITNNYRIATEQTLTFPLSIEVNIAEGFDVHVSYFSGGAYQNSTGWCKRAIIEKGEEVKIMVKRVTENTAEMADIDEYYGALSARSIIVSKLDKVNTVIEDVATAKTDIETLRKTVSNDRFIKIRDFNKINFHLEYGNYWTANPIYGGVLIPRDRLSNTIKMWSDTFKIVVAFLRDDNIVDDGKAPNYCTGTSVIKYKAGIVKSFTVPDDCAYLYVYVSKDNHDLVSIELTPVYEEIASVKNACSMPVYISGIDQVIRTIKHRHDGAESGFVGTNVSDDLLVLAHISDVHYDTTVYGRFMDFLNDNPAINAGVVTGDIIDYPNTNEYADMVAVESTLDDSDRLIKVMGNHEMLSSSMTPEKLYGQMEMNTNTGKLYYYKDYVSQKIRVIVLNQYDVVSSDYLINGGTNHFTMEQINWFVDTLKDASEKGYAVIVAYHSCEAVGLPKWNNKGFCQEVNFARSSEIISDSVIEDIINAWQNGGSLEKTYTYTDIDTVLNINISFSQSGLFVCFLCGHEHVDYIGYSRKYPTQLICLVQGAVVDSNSRTEEVAHWQSRYDTPRVSNTSTMDSINVYGIDTKNRLLKVAKIGSTLTDKFVPRSFATFYF